MRKRAKVTGSVRLCGRGSMSDRKPAALLRFNPSLAVRFCENGQRLSYCIWRYRLTRPAGPTRATCGHRRMQRREPRRSDLSDSPIRFRAAATPRCWPAMATAACGCTGRRARVQCAAIDVGSRRSAARTLLALRTPRLKC